MKLFKRLLIAPAALGLLSPLAASANDINFSEVSNYSETTEISTNSFKPLSNQNPLLAGGEGLSNSNDFDGDSFSSTTTLDGKAVMAIGAIGDGSEIGESEKDWVQT